MSETLPEETLEEYAQKTGIPLEVLRRQLQWEGGARNLFDSLGIEEPDHRANALINCLSNTIRDHYPPDVLKELHCTAAASILGAGEVDPEVFASWIQSVAADEPTH